MAIKKWLLKFHNNQRGEAVFTFPLVVAMLLIMTCIGTNIAQYGLVALNLKSITNETLQIVKFENGSDADTRQKFYDLVKKHNMNPSEVTYSATSKLVQRGDPVSVTATTTFHVWAMALIGVDNYTVPVVSTSYGLAYKYIREGG